MMNDHGNSDSCKVPAKFANKDGATPSASGMEGRRLTKGNMASKTRFGLSIPITTCKARLTVYARSQVAKRECDSRTSCTISTRLLLRAAYFSMKKSAAAGIDGETWKKATDKFKPIFKIFLSDCIEVDIELSL